MNKELNKINIFINANKYYFLDMNKKTIINDFDISDFLINLYEKKYEEHSIDSLKTISNKFKEIADVEDYLMFNQKFVQQIYNFKYTYEYLKSYIDILFSNSNDVYNLLGDALSKMGSIEYSIISDIKLEKDLSLPLEVYSFTSYDTFILFTIFKSLSLNIKFNKCKNCGKYFVPTAKSNEIYCTRIYRNNKTCRDIGYENSVQSDKISKAYRNAYKTQNAKKQRNKNIPNIDDKFSYWATEAKEMYKLCKDNKIKFNEFNKWLKDHQDWINK